MKDIFKKFKFIAIAVIFTLGINYSVLAFTDVWSGPSANPPSNNQPVVIHGGTQSQQKGGGPTLSSLLNILGTTKTNNMYVWNNTNVGDDTPPSGDVYITSLTGSGTNTRVCVDTDHKLIVCAPSGGGGGGGGGTGTPVNAYRYCGLGVIVWTGGETEIDAGVHVWTDPTLQTPVPESWQYLQHGTTGRAFRLVPGDYTNTTKLGEEVTPC